ncbi:MAG: abortive infection family protein [Hyphomicrobium sp.]
MHGNVSTGCVNRAIIAIEWGIVSANTLLISFDYPISSLGTGKRRGKGAQGTTAREAIEKNQPEGRLDRLHTFANKFTRVTCEPHGISITRNKPLHSVFGEYVKALRNGEHLESAMTERILKSSISVLEAFNDVRNNKSLPRDNPILNYAESLLIFSHVAASIRFIKALETKIKAKARAAEQQTSRLQWADDIPF